METQHRPSSVEEEIDARMLSFFQDGVRMLGLPKSVGEIYGTLYVSRSPLTMVDLVERLGMSKGSASQGLRMLRTLGAVREIEVENDRRTYYQADIELKKLVGGFIREEIRPHLKSGQEKLKLLEEKVSSIEDPDEKDFYKERVTRLGRWSKKANLILPMLQKFLGE